MVHKLKDVLVELSTPHGSFFCTRAAGVEMRTTDGVIAINPQDENYLNLTQTTRITLRVGKEFLSFVLKNAAASLRDGHLTVLAEEISPVPGMPVSTRLSKIITSPSKRRKP